MRFNRKDFKQEIIRLTRVGYSEGGGGWGVLNTRLGTPVNTLYSCCAYKLKRLIRSMISPFKTVIQASPRHYSYCDRYNRTPGRRRLYVIVFVRRPWLTVGLPYKILNWIFYMASHHCYIIILLLLLFCLWKLLHAQYLQRLINAKHMFVFKRMSMYIRKNVC